MTLEVSVVTRTLDNDSSKVTSYALVTLDGQPVQGLQQRDFSLYVPARKYLDDASVWGQGFGFVDTYEYVYVQKATDPGLPGVYELQLTPYGTDELGQRAWVSGWYMGVLEVTHTVEVIVGVRPGYQGPGQKLETESRTYKAKTIFSFNIWT
ncbi:hypothetical protein [Paraburkholderia hospita]|uniref:hypothetical protein n=1 Tax=Paraburkholderia hospita TaxID=169430 RepID=UPI0009A77303|nr:hypothetical protein [Paraburkholderia hospita]SKC69573.1 hypothetical protein SAMN05446934_1960 [Paraburkholderia hospita]